MMNESAKISYNLLDLNWHSDPLPPVEHWPKWRSGQPEIHSFSSYFWQRENILHIPEGKGAVFSQLATSLPMEKPRIAGSFSK